MIVYRFRSKARDRNKEPPFNGPAFTVFRYNKFKIEERQ